MLSCSWLQVITNLLWPIGGPDLIAFTSLVPCPSLEGLSAAHRICFLATFPC